LLFSNLINSSIRSFFKNNFSLSQIGTADKKNLNQKGASDKKVSKSLSNFMKGFS